MTVYAIREGSFGAATRASVCWHRCLTCLYPHDWTHRPLTTCADPYDHPCPEARGEVFA